MTRWGKNNKMRKMMVSGLVLSLALSTCTPVFAQGGPGGGQGGDRKPQSSMDGGRGGDDRGSDQGGSDHDRPDENQGQPGVGSQNDNVQNGNSQWENMAPPTDSNAQPGENVPAQPSAENQDGDTEREDMTPPEDPDAEPGENVPEKPADDQDKGEQPADQPDEKPELKGIDLMAVKAYIEAAGDDVDEDVQSAYETLAAALAEDPDEDGDDDAIAALEEALSEALENAGIDLEEYTETPSLPEKDSPKDQEDSDITPSEDAVKKPAPDFRPEPSEEVSENSVSENAKPAIRKQESTGAASGPLNFIKNCWQKFMSLF